MPVRVPLRLAVLSAAFAAALPLAAAEHLLVDARIHSGLPGAAPVEAMVWNGTGELLALGSARELRARFPQAQVHSAGGRAVIPGMIDAHAHLMGLGQSLAQADLMGARSKDEILGRLRAFEAELPAGAWLQGRGWDQNLWPEQDFPTAADLDAAFPGRPVWLVRVDGHAAWGNSAALAQATADLGGDWHPDGGRILRDDAGQPTGVFIDTAMRLVDAAIPAPDEAMRELRFARALEESVSLGLTGVHDMGVSLADIALYRRFADSGRLPLRVTAYADGDREALTALCAFGPIEHPSGRLKMRGVKLYADGALGSRGAALIADYSDEPGSRGLLVTSEQGLEQAMRKARGCGLQVAAHAIGDRGNRIVIGLFEQTLGANPGDHRWRVEHAQIVAVADIARFAAIGAMASMQPIHATSDMPWVPARIGPNRLGGAYAWQRFLQAGVGLPFGSDFPVEPVNPMLGLYAAVTRQDLDGQPPGGWLPDQKLSLAEALHGFTLGAARASFDEARVGSLEIGKQADFVLLDRDPFAVDAVDLPKLQVLQTWVGGERVFERR